MQSKKWCARYGVLKVIVSDNGPQFMAREFRKFITEWNIKHMLSAPYHQHSNGKAESAVKIIKNLMRKCIKEGTNMYLAFLSSFLFLEQRNMPRQCQDSPGKMMFGRNLRTQIPQKSTKFPEQAKKLN